MGEGAGGRGIGPVLLLARLIIAPLAVHLAVTLPKTEPSPIRKIAVKAREMLTGESE